jgi:hypothetical protein
MSSDSEAPREESGVNAVERARAVLAAFSARHLRYYGPLAVTDLSMDGE